MQPKEKEAFHLDGLKDVQPFQRAAHRFNYRIATTMQPKEKDALHFTVSNDFTVRSQLSLCKELHIDLIIGLRQACSLHYVATVIAHGCIRSR